MQFKSSPWRFHVRYDVMHVSDVICLPKSQFLVSFWRGYICGIPVNICLSTPMQNFFKYRNLPSCGPLPQGPHRSCCVILDSGMVEGWHEQCSLYKTRSSFFDSGVRLNIMYIRICSRGRLILIHNDASVFPHNRHYKNCSIFHGVGMDGTKRIVWSSFRSSAISLFRFFINRPYIRSDLDSPHCFFLQTHQVVLPVDETGNGLKFI